MANPDHLSVLKRGVNRWNRWRESNPSIVPDLTEADLGSHDLRGADLRRVDLTGARLDGARLVGSFYCGSTKWPAGFDVGRSGALPFRTNISKSLLFREIAEVVAHSTPILITQALVAIAFVYSGQGRGFLSFGGELALRCAVAGNAVAAVIFARILARKVAPDQSVDPNSDDRIRWLGLQCGSIVVGLIVGFLPAILIEMFLSGDNCGIPVQARDFYRYGASNTTTFILLPLWFYAAWRAVKNAPRLRDLLWLILPAASALSVWLVPRFSLTVLFLLLIAATYILTLVILQGPAPHKARGTVFGHSEQLIVLLFLTLGIYISIRPAGLPSSFVLFVIPTFWTTIAVLVNVYLRRWWESRLWLFFATIALLIFGAVWVSFSAFKAHEIRKLTGQPAARLPLADLSKQWLGSRLTASYTKERPYTVVLVAAAGGGIRAASWTAALLGCLQDLKPKFKTHLFAVSSVSGGSVGAAVFAGLLKANCDGSCEKSARAILFHDFLAPPLASLLTRDLLGIGYPRIPDRAVALEREFERAWRAKMPSSTLEESFDQLWKSGADFTQPSLFFNSTEAGSAKRVVFSNASLLGISTLDKAVEAEAQKLPLRLSTAMLLSARFPYISPEGLAGPNGEYRFVDGGYFDNSGAATLRDVVLSLRQAAVDLHALDRVQFATLVIANEPITPPNCVKPKTGGFATPLEILDKLRQARAEDFLQSLRGVLTDRERDLFVDDLRPKDVKAEYPLAWSLPPATLLDIYREAGSATITALKKLDRLLE